MTRTPRVGAAALGLMLLAACTQGEQQRLPAAEPTTENATASPTDSPQAERVAHSSSSHSTFLAADRVHVVQQRGKNLQVTERDKARRVLTLPLRDQSGRALTAAEVDGRWLVVQYLGGEGETAEHHLRLHDLERKRPPLSLNETKDIPGPGLPAGFQLADGHLLYTSQEVGETSCLVDLSLSPREARVVQCGGTADQGLGHPAYTEHGITYNQWTPGAPRGQGCVTLHVVPRAGPPTEVSALSHCGAWSGLVFDEYVVWSEPRPGTPDESDIYAREMSGGDVIELGRGDTGSHVLCGDQVVWISARDGLSSISRWRPGQEVEELHGMPEGAMLISRLRCRDSLLTFHQSADGPDRVDLMALETPPSVPSSGSGDGTWNLPPKSR